MCYCYYCYLTFLSPNAQLGVGERAQGSCGSRERSGRFGGLTTALSAAWVLFHHWGPSWNARMPAAGGGSSILCVTTAYPSPVSVLRRPRQRTELCLRMDTFQRNLTLLCNTRMNDKAYSGCSNTLRVVTCSIIVD